MFEKAIIFGASRGLGQAVAEHVPLHVKSIKNLMLCSRKEAPLSELRKTLSIDTQTLPLDLTTVEGQDKALAILNEHDFDLVIYCSGGGPHGEFSKKEWKDHNWSLQLNLVAPLRLIHGWLKKRDPKTHGRFVAVGSRIAENTPDPLASSYVSGKRGLSGFIETLQPELENNFNKVWLFSPGYMNTDMLPLNAKVRQDGSKIMAPEAAAQALLRWIIKDGPWHRVLN